MWRFSIIVVLVLSFECCGMPAAMAQRGGLVQDLFRSIAEAQLERVQREQAEAQQRANPNRVPVPPMTTNRDANFNRYPTDRGVVVGPFPNFGTTPSTNIYPNNSSYPPANYPPPNYQTPNGQIPDVSVRRPGTGIDNVTLTSWRSLQSGLNDVTNRFRQSFNTNSGVRNLIGSAYRLNAQTDAMLNLAGVANGAQRIADSYPAFDRDYRQFSFDVRNTAGISPEVRSAISQTDRTVNSLARSYTVQPQWDRRRFGSIATRAGHYLETIIDDMELISMNSNDRSSITRDLRLLVRQANQIQENADRMSYEQAAEAFNQFTAAMTPIATSLRQVRNPHIDRRLDRLRELADETYSVLWMSPPMTAENLLTTARRMEATAEQLRDALFGSALDNVPRSDRNRIEDLVRDVDRNAHDLVRQMERDPSGASSTTAIRDIDGASRELVTLTRGIRGNHHAPMTLLRDEIESLMRATRTTAAPDALNYGSLLRAAATLEGTGEAIRNEVRRVDRYLPSSLRNSASRAADNFYNRAREFHNNVADRRTASDLRDRAQELITPWRELNETVDNFARGGAPNDSAALLRRYRDGLIPAVADIAAMLNL